MKLKKIVSGKELQEKMQFAVDLLCDTVKRTLGPKGSNIIIDHSAFTPFITNDGVTIAQNIESEDVVINTILELTKEASIKTNDIVGDGTTTTLVLLQSIYNQGLEYVKNEKNPIVIKKELEKDMNLLIKKIKNQSKIPTDNDLLNIAITSSASFEIGKIVSDAYFQVRDKFAIKIKENTTSLTEVVHQKGYLFETILASNLFFTDKNEVELENVYLLIINNYLVDIEQIALFINEALNKNKPLIVLADDYSDDIINNILALNSEQNEKVYLLKIPEYGKNKLDLLNDLELISNCKIINDLNNIDLYFLGEVNGLKLTNEESIIYFTENNNIKEKIKELRYLIKDNLVKDDNFLYKRIAMFENGIINILVGAPTSTERREKRMRYDDALCAISSASRGVLIGSGIAFYKLSKEVSKEEMISDILLNCLKEPLKQILYNAGLNQNEIIKNIEKSKYNLIYNVLEDKYEEIDKTIVLDSTEVVVNSLINACSIASMLLTTTSLIINEYKNNAHKINDFTDL